MLASAEMPGAQWFPGTLVNYAERAFRDETTPRSRSSPAARTARTRTWSWGELRAQTQRIAAGLRKLGVETGDRVAAYLPNIPETVAAFLAAASLGAVWSSCSPDFGPRA